MNQTLYFPLWQPTQTQNRNALRKCEGEREGEREREGGRWKKNAQTATAAAAGKKKST